MTTPPSTAPDSAASTVDASLKLRVRRRRSELKPSILPEGYFTRDDLRVLPSLNWSELYRRCQAITWTEWTYDDLMECLGGPDFSGRGLVRIYQNLKDIVERGGVPRVPIVAWWRTDRTGTILPPEDAVKQLRQMQDMVYRWLSEQDNLEIEGSVDGDWVPSSVWRIADLIEERGVAEAQPRVPESDRGEVALTPPVNKIPMTIDMLAAKMRKDREAPLTKGETKSPQRGEAAHHIERHLAPAYPEQLPDSAAKFTLFRQAGYSGYIDGTDWPKLVWNGKKRITDGKTCRFDA